MADGVIDLDDIQGGSPVENLEVLISAVQGRYFLFSVTAT